MRKYTFIMIPHLLFILLAGAGLLGLLLEGGLAKQVEMLVWAIVSFYGVLFLQFIFSGIRQYRLDQDELQEVNLLGWQGTKITLGSIKKIICETGDYAPVPIPYWRLNIIYVGGNAELDFGAEEPMAGFVNELKAKAKDAGFFAYRKNRFYTKEIKKLSATREISA